MTNKFIRILLVDDDPTLLSLIRDLLSEKAISLILPDHTTRLKKR